VALVLDTGVLYAMLDEGDPDHDGCADLVDQAEEQLVIPAPVFVELDYWIRKVATADVWLAFCEDVDAGAYAIYPLDGRTLLFAGQLQAKYADLPLGLVDAAVFTVCEVLGERKVATLDRRYFSVLRKEDGRPLDLLPER
jgi:predicted nucleic acid-binding protein